MFIKKWGTLEIMNDENNKSTSAGHLEVDLAIISSNEQPAPVALQTHDDDIIEE